MNTSQDKDMTIRVLHGQKQRQRHDQESIAWTEAKIKDMTTRVLHGQKQRHDHKSFTWTEAKTTSKRV